MGNSVYDVGANEPMRFLLFFQPKSVRVTFDGRIFFHCLECVFLCACSQKMRVAPSASVRLCRSLVGADATHMPTLLTLLVHPPTLTFFCVLCASVRVFYIHIICDLVC